MQLDFRFYNFVALSKHLGSSFFDFVQKRSRRYRRLFRSVEVNIIQPGGVEALMPTGVANEMGPLRSHPTISVIISTYNRAELLRNTLASLEVQRSADFEVVVVCGPCTDHTREILKLWEGRLKVAYCAELSVSASRNVGVSHANGELLAFLDDDAVPEPDWIEAHLRTMRLSDAVATGGPIRNRDGLSFQCRRLVASQLADIAPTFDRRADDPPHVRRRLTLTGTNFMVTRAAVEAVGGFDENYRYFLEETDLVWRIARCGGRLAYAADAEVHHYRSANLVRGSDCALPDYSVLLTSLSYFCLRQRLPDVSDAEICDRIARELQKIARSIKRLRRGGLNEREARQIWRNALKSLRAFGRHEWRGPARIARTQAEGFLPFAVPRESRRIAIVACGRGASKIEAAEAIAREKASLGWEVSLILDPTRKGSVVFRDGVWRHHPARNGLLDWLLGSRSAARAAAELRRIRPRRDFHHVIDLAKP